MRRAGAPEGLDLVARGGDELEIGLEPRRPRRLQHRRPARRIAAPRRVHDVMRAGQAEMQHARLRAAEVEVIGAELRRHAGVVEMRAPPAFARIDAIGEGGLGAGQREQALAPDAVEIALVGEETALSVVADHAHRLDRHDGIETLDVDGHVAARTAALTVEFEDVVHRVFGRPARDRLVEVDAPGSRGQNAPTSRHRRLLRISAALR